MSQSLVSYRRFGRVLRSAAYARHVRPVLLDGVETFFEAEALGLGSFISGSDFQIDGGVTASYWYGETRSKMTAGTRMNVLIVGATGSIGQLVVADALREGNTVRALVRDPGRAKRLPPKTELVVGDLSQPASLTKITDEIDAIKFTQGADGGKAASKIVDYGGVRNMLNDLGSGRDRPLPSWATAQSALEPYNSGRHWLARLYSQIPEGNRARL